MTVLSLSGPVARLDVPSADGRQLVAAGYIPPGGEVPLLALHAGVNPRHGFAVGAEPVGTITGWAVEEGVLSVVGEVEDDQLIPASRYRCQLDCRWDPADVEVNDTTGLTLIRRWTPRAVTLHLPGATVGAVGWPDLPSLTVAPPA